MKRQILSLFFLLLIIHSGSLYCQNEDQSITSLPDTIFFRLNSSVVDSAQSERLELVAGYLAEHPEANLEIIGYESRPAGKTTASIGTRFSRSRPHYVSKMLIGKYGVDKSRITFSSPAKISREGGVKNYVTLKVRHSSK